VHDDVMKNFRDDMFPHCDMVKSQNGFNYIIFKEDADAALALLMMQKID
jgi:hypothetical protein